MLLKKSEKMEAVLELADLKNILKEFIPEGLFKEITKEGIILSFDIKDFQLEDIQGIVTFKPTKERKYVICDYKGEKKYIVYQK